ncbi:hypothetical protein [Ornithinimicrobium kibberense]|uniref:hypothetical protein n=1 Tax=Ornithinimicrobium kibberense TaxID=282060 RepID=UPI00361072E7
MDRGDGLDPVRTDPRGAERGSAGLRPGAGGRRHRADHDDGHPDAHADRDRGARPGPGAGGDLAGPAGRPAAAHRQDPAWPARHGPAAGDRAVGRQAPPRARAGGGHDPGRAGGGPLDVADPQPAGPVGARPAGAQPPGDGPALPVRDHAEPLRGGRPGPADRGSRAGALRPAGVGDPGPGRAARRRRAPGRGAGARGHAVERAGQRGPAAAQRDGGDQVDARASALSRPPRPRRGGAGIRPPGPAAAAGRRRR